MDFYTSIGFLLGIILGVLLLRVIYRFRNELARFIPKILRREKKPTSLSIRPSDELGSQPIKDASSTGTEEFASESGGGQPPPPTSSTTTPPPEKPGSPEMSRAEEELEAMRFRIIAIIVNAVILLGSLVIELLFPWVGMTLIVLQIIYTFFSIKKVRANRLAMRLVFGKFGGNLSSGLCYIPLLIAELVDVTTEVIEHDLPGSPEEIYHGDPAKRSDGSPGDGTIPTGKVPALRVTFPARKIKNPFEVKVKRLVNGVEEEVIVGTIPVGDSFLMRQTAEVEFSYGFRIRDLFTFYKTIGNVENAVQAMDDHAIGGFTSRLSKVSLAEAMLLFEEISSEVKGLLSEYSQSWGIEVTFARMKPLNFSHAFNTALAEAAASVEQRRKTIIASQAQRVALRNVGLGNADAAYELLSARADGLQEIAQVAQQPGGAISMSIEGITRGLETARAIIVPEGNLFGAAAGITKIVEQMTAVTNQAGIVPPPATSAPQATTPTATAPQTPTNTTPSQPPRGDNRGGGRGNRRGRRQGR